MKTGIKTSIALIVITILLISGVGFVFYNTVSAVKELQITVNKSQFKEGLDVGINTRTDGLWAFANVDVNVSVMFGNQVVYGPAVVKITKNQGSVFIKYDDLYVSDGEYTVIAAYQDKTAQQKVSVIANLVENITVVTAKNEDMNDPTVGNLSITMNVNTSAKAVDFLWTKGNGTIYIYYNSTNSTNVKEAYKANFTYNYSDGMPTISIGSEKYNMSGIKIDYREFAYTENGTYTVRVDFTNNPRTKTPPATYYGDNAVEIVGIPGGKNPEK